MQQNHQLSIFALATLADLLLGFGIPNDGIFQLKSVLRPEGQVPFLQVLPEEGTILLSKEFAP